MTVVRAEDVFGFEIAVVDAEFVAEFDGVDDLDEDGADEIVIGEVAASFGDHAEKVAIGIVRENDVDAGRCLDDVVKGSDVGVGGGETMKGDLPTLKRPLPPIHPDLVEALDGVMATRAWSFGARDAGWRDVLCEVDDTVGTETEY